MSDVEIDENELFNSAVSDEPETPAVIEPVVEQEEPAVVQEEEPAAELTAEKPPIPPKPEYRLKEDAERARAAETELANERAEKAALRLRLEALERPAPKVEPEKTSKPDPLLDPEGYEKYLETRFEERLLNDRRESSLANAHKTHGKEFEEAYASAQKNIDPALKARMQQSRDPGETLIQWHREEKARAEVGTDLNAYNQRKREELLKDPEFRKAAMAVWREQAPSQTNGRPNISLPPSTNGISRASASLRADNEDVSDAELFHQTTG